jgi:uncharacterized protein with HEPN domain
MQRDESYFLDMLEAARSATSFTAGMTFDQFAADEKVLSAVLWQIAILGEAAAKISKESCQRFNIIPWRDIRDMRNKLVHDYRQIDVTKVWNTVQQDIPELIRLLVPLVPSDT